jgi:PAS domain S-box-containing protein
MTEPLRLFLVEEDDDIALLIRKCLERVDAQVTRCRTGTDALIVLSHHTYDLLVLDPAPPDRTGTGLLQALGRAGITVPVLAVLRREDEPRAADILRAGALDFLVKDASLAFLAELPQRIAEVVSRYRLQQMNGLLAQALESARDGIVITDLQGTIVKVNQALESMTGYTRDELLGQTPRLFKSGQQAPEVYAELWQTVLGGASWQGELTNRRKDGSLFQASLTVSPIRDGHGRLTHLVGIQRDVTAQKQLERQLLQAQKMQSLGTLAGGVAHEFNNVLAGINGYAALGLREPGLSLTLREFLQQIVDLSERAATLTRQLLVFARQPTLTRCRLDLARLARDTAALVTHSLHQEVRLEMPSDGGSDAPLWIAADANQLQQALINLALNARDAQRECAARDPQWAEGKTGSPPVIVRLAHVVLDCTQAAFPHNVPPGDYVLLQVEDQGVGMTPDVLAQALDPFFTTKDVGKGTGLGLPMVYGIVQGHQGYLAIDSMPGRGTCVGLYLPRLVDKALDLPTTTSGWHGQLAARGTPAVETMAEPVPGGTILVIDDEAAVLDVVRRCLQVEGHHVLCANSGWDALEMLNGWAVDLVLLDLLLPREDAATILRRLRQRRPGLPVLLCTGQPQADPAPELLRQPDVDLLRKPFHMHELWQKVRQALAGSGRRKAEG